MPKRNQSVTRGILSFFLFLVFAALVVMIIVLVVPTHSRYKAMERRLEEMEKDLAEKNAECLRLQRIVHDFRNNPEAIEKVGREKFNLTRKGEVIYQYDPALIPDKDK